MCLKRFCCIHSSWEMQIAFTGRSLDCVVKLFFYWRGLEGFFNTWRMVFKGGLESVLFLGGLTLFSRGIFVLFRSC